MKFEYSGLQYRLAFQRDHKEIAVIRDGVTKTVRSKYPYTTAILYEVRKGAEPAVIARGTVGCLDTDQYSNENGRRFALRLLTRTLAKRKQPEALRRAIWASYLGRVEPRKSYAALKAEVAQLAAELAKLKKESTTSNPPDVQITVHPLPGLPESVH